MQKPPTVSRSFALSLCSLLLSLLIPFARGIETAVVDLTGSYSAVVTVRNADGSPAAGKKYRLTYITPSEREVVLNKGTDLEFKFQFEPVTLIATITAGTLPADGRLQLKNLAGEPRKFGLQVGEDGSGPADIPEGFLQISFPDRHQKTNEFTLVLAKIVVLGEAAPNFSVHDVFTGAIVTRSNFMGKLLVLKFWATTCAPCQPEMEQNTQLLLRRKKDWKDKVAFVAVSLDENLDKLSKHIQSHGWTEFQHVWTEQKETGFNSEIAKCYGIVAIPTCYIVHPSGVILWRGHMDTAEGIIDHVLKEVKTKEDVQTFLRLIDDARLQRKRTK